MVKSKNSNAADKNIIIGTRKRNKKVVFDPSDNNLPKRRKSCVSRSNSITEKDTESTAKKIKSSLSNFFKDSIKCETREGTTHDNGSMSGVCSVCRKQKNDKFISCCDCCNKAHASCLDTNIGILRMRPDNTWQCPHCKTCVFCEETADSGVLTVCKICADAYHSLCHTPKIKHYISASPNWVCRNCKGSSSDMDFSVMKLQNSMDVSQKKLKNKHIKSNIRNINISNKSKNANIPNEHETIIKKDNSDKKILTITLESNDGKSAFASEDLKNVQYELVYSEDFGYEIDPRIPDIANWSCDDVCNYFMDFFPDDANVFKDEEIDGLALLLMSRETVMKNLKLKLGTALKVWKHVVTLQERRENIHRLFL